MEPIISVQDLSKTFAYHVKGEGVAGSIKNLFHRQKLYKKAVQDVSFDIAEGEFVGFLGPNGAGKTTTLKMLSGILYPTSGSARVLGYIPWEKKNDYKRQFSIIMGQKNQLWWDLPARESLRLNQHIYEIDDKTYRETVEELSALLDVQDVMDVQVRRLSLGERMKLEIIAALLHQPKVVFLDEPTIGLDLVSQKNIRRFLTHYNRTHQTTILLTSHYMRDIEDLCSRIIVINNGTMVFDGSKEGMRELLGDRKIASIQFSKEIAKSDLERIGTVRKYEHTQAELELPKDGIYTTLEQMMRQLPVMDFSIADIPLEESLELLYQKQEDSHAEV